MRAQCELAARRDEIVSQRPSLPRWEARGREILPAHDPIPKVMGIVNLTPDSFSDGGSTQHPEAALAHAQRLAAEGADLLDLGGESSRPGAEPVSLAEELRRVIPVVEAIASQMTIPLSIDTTKAEVARQALKAGAVIINDITALGADPAMAARRRRHGGRRRPHAHAGHARDHAAQPALQRRRDRGLRLPGAASRVGRGQWHSPRADRHRSRNRLRQDVRA